MWLLLSSACFLVDNREKCASAVWPPLLPSKIECEAKKNNQANYDLKSIYKANGEIMWYRIECIDVGSGSKA